MVERPADHKTLPVATAALGRSLMAAHDGNQLKDSDGSVTCASRSGPLGITVVSDSQGNARGRGQSWWTPLKGPAKLMWAAVGGRLPHCHQESVHEGAYVGTVPWYPARSPRLPPTLLSEQILYRLPWACWWT